MGASDIFDEGSGDTQTDEAKLKELQEAESSEQPPTESQEEPEEPEEKPTEEEPEEPEEPGEDDGKPPKGYVPHQALHQERMRAREERDVRIKLEERLSQFDQLQKELLQHRQQQQTQEQKLQEEQAYQDDPVGYLRTQNERLQQRIQQFEQGQQQSAQQWEQVQKQQQALQQVATHVRASEEQFRQKAPDYDDAFKYLEESRRNEYQAYGIADPNAQQQALYQEVLQLSVAALQQGRDPAELLYETAKYRGYQAGNPDDKVETAKKGQSAAKTLNDGRGKGEPGKKLSLSQIETMSDEEFDQLWDEMDNDARGRN